MAENSGHESEEGWSLSPLDADGFKDQELSAGPESLSGQPVGEESARLGSPQSRSNPFLSRRNSDSAPQGLPASQASDCWRSEATGSQQLTPGDQRSAPTAESPPVMSGSPPTAASSGSDFTSYGPLTPADCGADDMTLVTSAGPTGSSSAITGAVTGDSSSTGLTPDFASLPPPPGAASTPATPAITATHSNSLPTAPEPSPPLDPYLSQSHISSDPRPASPPPAPDSCRLSSPLSPRPSSPLSPRPSSPLSPRPSSPLSPHHLTVLPAEAGALSSGDEDWERRPPAERWAPLGANDADDEEDDADLCLGDRRSSLSSADLSRLRRLEEEQEHLNNSLMALTTHFAQVQFRLRQIVEAPTEEKEQLLQELETFAFRGIPDVRQYKLTEDTEQELTSEWKHQELVESQREKQRDLMRQLKTQLEDLEHYAYETGEAGLPSSVVLEKQRVIIDELKGKLNIDLNNLDEMTSEDLKSLVDCAVGQLINPLKMKEQLVNQLKTQVQDLERFIAFLQGETEEGGCDGSCRRGGGTGGAASASGDDSGAAGDAAGPRARLKRRDRQQEVHEETSSLMRRALTLLQLMTLTQFGCGGHAQRFSSNELKKTPRGNHWGDLRARLELAVSAVSELARASLREQQELSDRGTDESDAAGPPAASGDRLTLAVRRELAVALRDLIQHGLLQLSRSRSVVPFSGCLPSRQSAPRLLHAWDLVLVYYRLKRGAQFNATPQRRLSQSFGLSVVGGTAITSKHTLLSAIGNIISSHTPLKRSADAHFKAFVCAGLNARKLSSWLRLILTTQAITEEYYQPWSYVISTGFDDALQCISRLEKMRFALPEDLAVRQLKNIRDAF